ncbi:MAG: HAMP domain-containing histidine kinase [Deltaproteobacteria bacterium]|nr:HAMP domain-containing histidine kinase [Deltaproteobacteria bacterium]
MQQQIIGRLEEERRQNEKLTLLAAFAAGAAHELSTPLSTIAIASEEMLHHFKKHGGDQDIVEDTRLIREQINRCKEILFQMSAEAGEHLGEPDTTFNLSGMITEIVTSLNLEHACDIQFVNSVCGLSITMPLRIFRRTLRSLLKNAIDASPPAANSIVLTCRQDDGYLYFEVCDKGAGMDKEALQRATEPFYTSKEPGKGMGLGLYLAKMIARSFYGDFHLRSSLEEGTTALLSFAKIKVDPITMKESP